MNHKWLHACNFQIALKGLTDRYISMRLQTKVIRLQTKVIVSKLLLMFSSKFLVAVLYHCVFKYVILFA